MGSTPLVFTLGLSAVGFSAVVGAQQGSPAQEAVLEEIIVTATKRSENLQDVPISISAVTAAQLEARGVDHIQDLGAVVAGLNVASGTGLLFRIRGLGISSQNAGNESAVAVYLDGVYLASLNGLIRKLGSIEQIEVAKGPQGTLFGRNAMGGVISITTKDPAADPSAEVSLGYGNYDTKTGEVYLSSGLTDNLAANLDAYYSDQGEGYGENHFTGNEVNKTTDFGARSKWVYTPGERDKFTLAFDYARTDSSAIHAPHAQAGTYSFNVLGGPPIPAPSISVWDIDSFRDPDAFVEQYGASLRFEHSFNAAKLLSITAYRDYRLNHLIGPVVPLDAQSTRWVQADNAWTQELQLVSNGEGKLEWATGVFFLDGEQKYEELSFFGAQVAPLLKLDIGPGTAQTARSYAAFAQATYPLTASGRTRLTLGGRYTSDRRELTGHQELTFADGSTLERFQTDRSETFGEDTYRVSLDHRFADNTLGYVSFNQGFKSGLFNSVSLRANNAVPVVSPELVDAYEIGLKNELFNRRMRLNVAAYYYDVTDIQVVARFAAVSTLVNGARAEVYGLDADLEAKLSERLTLVANVAASRNEYKEFPNAPFIVAAPPNVGGNVIVSADAKGKHLNYAPELTGGVAVTYSLPVSFGEIGFSANYSYMSKWFDSPDNSFEAPETHTTNAQIECAVGDGRHRITLWGNNLTDEERLGQPNRPPNPGGWTYITAYGPPRTYGITYRIAF